MTLLHVWWMALAVTLGPLAGPVAAHPLPGSTVTLGADADSLDLIITLPLHELDLAMPGGTGLGADPADAGVSRQATDRLATYLADHLVLTGSAGETLVPVLTSARIEAAQNDHVGTYALLVLNLSAPLLPGHDAFPLALHYDAIMHEVRSHQATVLVQSQGMEPAVLGQVRIDLATGMAASLVIAAPP